MVVAPEHPIIKELESEITNLDEVKEYQRQASLKSDFERAELNKEKTGVEIKFINLSGGVGIPYTEDKEPNDIAIIGEGVHKKFDEIMVPAGMGDVAIFTELGRFMLAPYGGLVTKWQERKL